VKYVYINQYKRAVPGNQSCFLVQDGADCKLTGQDINRLEICKAVYV